MFIFNSVDVSAKTVSNPNHKGWVGKYPKLKPVEWKPIVTKCNKCVKITEQYNQVMQQLLDSRFTVKYWSESNEAELKKRNKGNIPADIEDKGDISEYEARVIGLEVERRLAQSSNWEVHRKLVTVLERQAHYLLQVLRECESTACPNQKPSKLKELKIEGATASELLPDVKSILKQHRIDWQGPYRTDCLPCKPIVAQLNALPGWVVRADMRLQVAKLLLAEQKSLASANIESLYGIDQPAATDTPYHADLIKSLINMFNQLVQQLTKCEAKYCPAKKDQDASYSPASVANAITDCPRPSAHEAIIVGANNDVGSRAKFKEKAKKKVAGLATKAITNLLGIGGGGGGKDQGPATYKDPVKSKQKLKIKNKADKRELRTGGVFTPDGLLISTDIKKAPGKGTFQTVYLENQRGWRLMPIALLMYEIWRDWKLNVSWTRDTYVDGELVKHEEGGWSESWRELIASGEQEIYAEQPIWEQLGFNTAVSGARSLGTLFPVSPQMLAQEPINLVIHVTEPKKDPVVTVPYVFRLSLGKKGNVVVEQVAQTAASEGKPCDESTPIIADAAPADNTAVNINDDVVTEEPIAPPACPEGWACMPGKQCPPIDNCTISAGVNQSVVGTVADNDIEEIDVTGSRITNANDDQVSTDAESTDASDEDIEEIEVTGSRISRSPDDKPVSITPEDLLPTPTSAPKTPETNSPVTTETPEEDIEEIEVSGSRIRRSPDNGPTTITLDDIVPTPSPSDNSPTDPTGTEKTTSGVDEVEATGGGYSSTDLKDFASSLELKYDYGTKVRLGFESKYDEGLTPSSVPPAEIYGEEIDPPIVGIVLKSFNRRWVPTHKGNTFVHSKIYVPGPNGKSWVPHPTASRKMKVTFIDRSNEKGMAMNADLPTGPQDSPDLYFNPARNAGTKCSDDPTGKGHYGTCETISPHNEYMWAINSDDYGGFSRLDVSCEGCVQLVPVAGMFPEAFTQGQRWEVALPEPSQEKRAVYVPHDSNKNQISDGWAPDLISSPSADQDNEKVPAGNGVDGDGLSAYEEYRGFIDLYDLHKRTDWDKKTLLIENSNRLNIDTFGAAAGLEVVPLEVTGHKNRIVNFNLGHANVVNQHGLRLKIYPSLNEKYAGYCFCDLKRPKGADKVTVKPAYRHSDTVAHELGHAVGMEHHGNPIVPAWDTNIRASTGGWRDYLPGKTHTTATLCGVTLPGSFTVGSKGDQGSGNHQCFMKYPNYHYVYEQAGGGYDCMPRTPRSIFDDSATGTGPNSGGRTAGNASNGDCKSQIWINSK